MTNQTYNVIGLMSGTSLDGVDIALCEFTLNENNKWLYRINYANTYEYDEEWKNRLMFADHNSVKSNSPSALDLAKLHVDYGHYLGTLINDFIKQITINKQLSTNIDFIASHGHTIFHQPDNKITFQVGEGAFISAETKLPVICDFRSTDVALGGQGAPLVPIGDKLLFGEYNYCLNLGGFANVSFDMDNRQLDIRLLDKNLKFKRVAFDICPVNIILNKLSQLEGQPYDNKGQLAAAGDINPSLFYELNSLYYYKKSYPKSLSKEWLDKYFIPVVSKYDISTKDKLRTIIEHINFQISEALQLSAESLLVQSSEFRVQRTITPNSELRTPNSLLITGGGAYNDFLIEKAEINISSEFRVQSSENNYSELPTPNSQLRTTNYELRTHYS